MPRGGKRPRAGRPKLNLTTDEQLWVFGEFSRLQNLLTARKHSRREREYLARYPTYRTVAEDQKRMRNWSPEQRRNALADADTLIDGVSLGDVRANLQPIGIENARRKGFAGPNYPDWVERAHYIPPTRLHARRQQILDLVAKRASKRFSKLIRLSAVRRIVESMSSHLRELEQPHD
jgi:hypothetical protein